MGNAETAAERAADASRRRRLAAALIHRVAAASFEAEEQERAIEAARERLDGMRSPNSGRERVSGGYRDPGAIAEGLHAVEVMEARLRSMREAQAELAALFDSVSADLSPHAAEYAAAALEEEAIGMRSTFEENMRRLERRRRRERPGDQLERYAREVASQGEIAAQLERRGMRTEGDLYSRY